MKVTETLNILTSLHHVSRDTCKMHGRDIKTRYFGSILILESEKDQCSICEGCDIVQSDHAPQAGVAQGIFNGDLIRRRDGHQVELEEELEEVVERRVRRNHSRSKTQVPMHG